MLSRRQHSEWRRPTRSRARESCQGVAATLRHYFPAIARTREFPRYVVRVGPHFSAMGSARRNSRWLFRWRSKWRTIRVAGSDRVVAIDPQKLIESRANHVERRRSLESARNPDRKSTRLNS